MFTGHRYLILLRKMPLKRTQTDSIGENFRIEPTFGWIRSFFFNDGFKELSDMSLHSSCISIRQTKLQSSIVSLMHEDGATVS